MLTKQLIKQAVDMQGFRIPSAKKDSTAFMVKIIPDYRPGFFVRVGRLEWNALTAAGMAQYPVI